MRDECARSNHLHTGRWASKGRASAEDESLPAARPLPYTAGCRARWFALPPRDRPQTGFAKGDGSKSPPVNCPLDPLPERRSGPPQGVSPAWGTVPRFFFNATATTEIYTLSLHDALPI